MNAVLSDLQKDALRELGNIGGGHAATALSQLLNTTVTMGHPTIEVIPWGELASRLPEYPHNVAGMHLAIRGDAAGQLVVVFERDAATDFVNVFLRRVVGEIEMFDSIVESTLKELGNIIAGAYISALHSLTGITMLPSVPTLSYGTMQDVFASLVTVEPQAPVFLIESTFFDKGEKITGQIMLIPDGGALGPLLSVFGIE